MSLRPNSKRLEGEAEDPLAIERTAVGLLARRDHSRAELQRKLRARGYDGAVIEAVLERLSQQRLQSDDRYVEAYVRARSDRGYGPERIRAELRERGIEGPLVDRQLADAGYDWRHLLVDVWRKKFAGRPPGDFRERARQMRFLQQRGFSADAIRALLSNLD